MDLLRLPRPWREALLLRFFVLLLCLLALLPGCRRAHRPVSPPLILILVDSLRVDRLATLGGKEGLTPALDALARDGVVFLRACAPSNRLRASVGSVFTGQFPTTHGAWGPNGVLPAKALLLSEALAERGFRSAGLFAHHAVGPEFGFGPGFDIFEHPPRETVPPGGGRLTEAATLNRAARELLQRWPGRPLAQGSWFLSLFYVDPAPPFCTHYEFPYRAAEAGLDGSRRSLGRLSRKESWTSKERKRVIELYDAEVAYFDHCLGELITWLKEQEAYSRSLIVVAGVRGITLGEYGKVGHEAFLPEEVVRVPLIIKLPEQAHAGLLVPGEVSLVDLAPTLLEWLGGPVPESMQGVSLVGALEDRLIPHDVLIEDPLGPKPRLCLIRARYKLLCLGNPLDRKANLRLFALPFRLRRILPLRPPPADRLAWLKLCLEYQWERAVRGAEEYSAQGSIKVPLTSAMRQEFNTLGYYLGEHAQPRTGAQVPAGTP